MCKVIRSLPGLKILNRLVVLILEAAADNLLASPSDSLTRGQLVMLADAVARYGVQDSTGTGRIDRDGIVLTGNGTEVT